MSPPDTNIEKQEKRHKGPLLGMPGAIIAAAVIFVGVMLWINVFNVDDEVETDVTTTVEGEEAGTAAEGGDTTTATE